MKLFSAGISLMLFSTLLTNRPARAEQWIAPTPEELSMTAQPEVPGASAIYLYREEKTDDSLHSFDIYVRIKVLTERGRDQANIELPYVSDSSNGSVEITDISGRTIHSDGTVVPFVGKPYQKLMEKSGTAKQMAKVFTLPDVQVGSILEYRYTRRLDDNWFAAPRWYVQTVMYTRKVHFSWRPTNKQLISNDDRGQLTSVIAWTPILPKGSEVKLVRLPAASLQTEGQSIITLDMQNILPVPKEEYMPPMRSLTYRVLFFYSPYRSMEEFWKSEGKHWAKQQDKFIGPGSAVGAIVQQETTASDTQEQKLRKLYASVMKLENTDFTREHSATEEKSQGLRQTQTADDVIARGRGTGRQLTDVFVAMARAAGMKAYVMYVTNRDTNVFLQGYLSLSQLDDYVAIVNVDGKEMFFDPGSRYVPFGQLAWKHTMCGGLRQTDGASQLAETPSGSYQTSRVQRVADLKLDEQGKVSGDLKLTYTGAPALEWRQASLAGDSTSLEDDLRKSAERMLPGGVDVKVEKITGMSSYDQPLTVEYSIKGAIGTATGKRLILPGDIFEANSKPLFPDEKRTTGVYFSYGEIMQDAVRITFPGSFTIESLPTKDQRRFQKFAGYTYLSESTPASFTIRRDFVLSNLIYLPTEYPELREFYSTFQTKDQESVVLKAKAASAASTPAGT